MILAFFSLRPSLLPLPLLSYTLLSYTQLCTFAGNGNEHIDLPSPAIVKPVQLWTGKQAWYVETIIYTPVHTPFIHPL